MPDSHTLSIYVKQIQATQVPEDDPETDLRLLVVLYGLRQSAYEWYTLLTTIFSDLGLFRYEADVHPRLRIYRYGSGTV